MIDGPITTTERIYQQIKALILNAELMPGKHLVQRQLAERFGTSSIPIIEAFRRLERDGLVVSHPNAGTRVKTWTRNDIEGVYLMREVLEGLTCRIFVERASVRDKAELIDYGRKYDDICRVGKSPVEIDIALHLHIVRSSQSPAMYNAIENSCILTSTIQSVSEAFSEPPEYKPLVGVHDDLISALVGGDACKGEDAGKRHIRVSLEKILNRIKDT
jgi:DNA-binding GntR family transcriptional regulator